MNKLLITLLIGYLLIHIGCNKTEVEIPEYAKYDWYAHYIIEGEEHTIVKDGTDRSYEPYLSSYQSYGYTVNPDSSEKDILYLYMTTGIQTTSKETDSIMWFSYDIITENEELIALKGKPKEERINTLVSYFTNMRYLYNSKVKTKGEFIDLQIGDKYGNTYKNIVFDNGTYSIILDYDIKVKKAERVEIEKYGTVVKVLIQVKATVNDKFYGQDRLLEAEVQTYFSIPFDD